MWPLTDICPKGRNSSSIDIVIVYALPHPHLWPAKSGSLAEEGSSKPGVMLLKIRWRLCGCALEEVDVFWRISLCVGLSVYLPT